MSALSAVSAPAAAGISIREFARREGCNDKLIRRAISGGYLKTLEDGTLSPALVGSGWRKVNRHAAAGADTADTSADMGADSADSADMSAPAVRTVRTPPAPVSAPVPAPGEVRAELEPQPQGGALKRQRRIPDEDAEGDEEEIDLDDFARRVLGGDFPALATSERVKAAALALRQVLAAQRLAGTLVELDLAEAVLFSTSRQARDAWLNWPAKFGPLLAADLGLEATKLVEALTPYVQQQLEELGEPQADFSEPTDPPDPSEA